LGRPRPRRGSNAICGLSSSSSSSSYAIVYSIFAIRSFTLALSDEFLYVTYGDSPGCSGLPGNGNPDHPFPYIVRMTKGLLCVSSARSNENLFVFICFIVGFKFVSIANYYSFIVKRYSLPVVTI
jgi:hypothetical protein